MSEPIVLLPTMMSDARLFGPQIAALSHQYSVHLAPVTQGERVEEIASGLMTSLPAKFALVGHGFGAVIAMEILRRAPDRVTRVCLMDTHPLNETPQVASAREPQIIAARMGRLDDALAEDLKPEFFAPTPYRQEIIELAMQMGRDLGSVVYEKQARAMQRRRDQQRTLREIRMPALIMCGQYDTVYPIKRHSFMAELIPYAKLKIIENAGLMPTLEQPDIVTDAIIEWMRQPLVLQ